MSNLLITGGAGFIGSNYVINRLNQQGSDKLVVLDALTYAGNRENLASVDSNIAWRFVKGDINDVELVGSIMRDEDIDTIIHFAAESHVDRSIHGPEAFVTTNINGTHNLLMCAREVWLTEKRKHDSHRFHHVSTDEVYGSLKQDDPMFTESTAFAPNSPYAASKAASDHLVRAYHKTYQLNTCISNCSNNYGPYQFPEKLIPLMLVNILHGKALPIYGDGKNIRDWLHVEDHCRAIDLLLEKGRAGETYNVGGENEIQNLDLVNELCVILDAKANEDSALIKRFPDCPAASGKPASDLITYVQDRAGHDRRYAIDPHKITQEINFKLKHDFPSGLRATVDWYLQNENWWQRVLDGSYRDWIKTQYS